jgi:hypothetical protein
MGGLVFANKHVPRMSLELYKRIRAECQSKLENLFFKVVVPREAPNKVDHGDVDYLVAGIKKPTLSANDIWFEIKDHLRAELHVARGGSHSYGIPHPDLHESYIQIDVEISPGNGTPEGPALFEWTRFMKGDSDLVQILGVAHRSLGVMCNDQGLHVLLPEIEQYDKKKALLFLTRDPDQAMEFYGLDTAKYWEGFTSEADLFRWATHGRFFSPVVFERRVETANDRARRSKRPMFARFLEEYMPAHPDENNSKIWTREEVLEKALQIFDKRAEYDAMIKEHQFKEAEEELWKEIRAVVPVESKSSLGTALKGLRRWVVFQDGKPQIASDPDLDDKPTWTKAMSPGSRDSLLGWVKDHWEEAKAFEKARAIAVKEAALAG